MNESITHELRSLHKNIFNQHLYSEHFKNKIFTKNTVFPKFKCVQGKAKTGAQLPENCCLIF